MSAAIEVLVQVVLLIVFVWVVVMGGMGALIGRARGGSGLEGFLWGAVLGPLGWAGIALRTRERRGSKVSAREWLQAGATGSTTSVDPLDDLFG